MHEYSRREILRAFALGGAFVAGELWIPGQRLISIPNYVPQVVSAVMTREEFRQMMKQSLDDAFMDAYQDPFGADTAAIKITLDEHSSQISMKKITHEELYVA